MTNGAAVGGAAERQDEVKRNRPGGGRIEFSAFDVADEGPQCAGLLIEGVAEGAAQLDVTLDLLAEEYSEVGHTAPPGKGSATTASCEAATFTYSAVVLMLRCPRRSATSLIAFGAPGLGSSTRTQAGQAPQVGTWKDEKIAKAAGSRWPPAPRHEELASFRQCQSSVLAWILDSADARSAARRKPA
jgi:hypothetical protein